MPAKNKPSYRRRFGSIRPTSGGRYQARWEKDGLRGAETFDTEKAADLYLKGVELDLATGKYVDASKSSDTLTAYALARWAQPGRFAPSGVKNATSRWNKWVDPFIGSRKLSEVTPKVINDWYYGPAAAAPVSQRRLAYNDVRAVLNDAFDSELIGRQPARIKGASQAGTSKRDHMEFDEFLAIKSKLSDAYATMLDVQWFIHARPGETVALQVGDFDAKALTVRIERQARDAKGGPIITAPKWGSAGTVDIDQELADLIAAHIATLEKAEAGDWLFPNREGQPRTVHSFQMAFAKARERAGIIKNVTLYSTKHSSLTALAVAGMTPKEVQERGRHKTLAASLAYQQVAESRRSVAVSALRGSMIGGSSGTDTGTSGHSVISVK